MGTLTEITTPAATSADATTEPQTIAGDGGLGEALRRSFEGIIGLTEDPAPHAGEAGQSPNILRPPGYTEQAQSDVLLDLNIPTEGMSQCEIDKHMMAAHDVADQGIRASVRKDIQAHDGSTITEGITVEDTTAGSSRGGDLEPYYEALERRSKEPCPPEVS